MKVAFRFTGFPWNEVVIDIRSVCRVAAFTQTLMESPGWTTFWPLIMRVPSGCGIGAVESRKFSTARGVGSV